MKEVYEKQTLHRLVGAVPRVPPTLPVNGGVNGSTNGNGQEKKPKSSGKESRPRTPVVYDGSVTSGSGSNAKANGKPHSGAARARQESVNDAWAEADMVLSDAETSPAAAARGEEQEGRYAIGLLPPKKRRKTGKYPADAHVVTFAVDSDDSSEDDLPLRPSRKERLKGAKDGLGGAQDGEELRIKGMSRSSSNSSRKERFKGVEDRPGGAQDGEEGGPLRIKGMSRSSSNSSLNSATKRDYWLSKGAGFGDGTGEED